MITRCAECQRSVPEEYLIPLDASVDEEEAVLLCARCFVGDPDHEAYERAYTRATDAQKERM